MFHYYFMLQNYLGLLFLMVLLHSVKGEDVDVNANKCQCTDLKEEAECKVDSRCTWLEKACNLNIQASNPTSTSPSSSNSTATVDQNQATATSTTTTSSPVSNISSQFCRTLSISECFKNPRCAYINQSCVYFVSCSAFIGNFKDCKAINNSCTSSFSGRCQVLLPCKDQKTEPLCNSIINEVGFFKCKWEEGACLERVCSDLNTNKVCDQFIPGCISNGKQCVAAPLPSCNTYRGNSITCQGFVGSDGLCEGEEFGQFCRSKACAKAPIYYNTNQLCSGYKLTCVTNGKGCIEQLVPCRAYSGTINSCEGYVGTDGNCKGVDQALKPCVPRICSEAPDSFKTDAECHDYQFGCVTIGRGCATQRPSCTTFQGTLDICAQYIGSEGMCYGSSITSATRCRPITCQDASKALTTNEACSTFKAGCVTTGEGCTDQRSCSDTRLALTCQGTPGCAWTPRCQPAQTCFELPSLGLCNSAIARVNNLGQVRQTRCIWSGGTCKDIECSDAPSSFSTAIECEAFLSGCQTTGKGCRVAEVICRNFKGTQSSCNQIHSKCWNASSANSDEACFERNCSDDPTLQSDQACQAFKTGCVWKGAGCIEAHLGCNYYQGTRAQCSAFKGKNGTEFCWNSAQATSTSTCRVKECTDNTLATTDAECASFLTDCLTNGSGCVHKTEPCSKYRGNKVLCNKFKGNSGTVQCWNPSDTVDGACVVKECNHASTSFTTDAQCEEFLSGCKTSGAGCEISQQCSALRGTQAQCASLVGQPGQKPCWSLQTYSVGPCIEKQCNHAPITYTSDAECSAFLVNCVTNGAGCTLYQRPCAQNQGSIAECTNLAGYNKRCFNQENCQDRKCSDVVNPSSNASCTTYLSRCRLHLGACVEGAACSLYSGLSIDQCRNTLSLQNTLCWWASGTFCTERQCSQAISVASQADCNSFKANCVFQTNKCVDKGPCTSYLPIGATDDIKRTFCQQLQDNNSVSCYFVTGATTCSLRECASAPSPSNQADCESFLAGCKWIGNKCVPTGACSTYTPFSASGTFIALRTICFNLADSSNNKCTLSPGSTTCIARTCANALGATQQSVCSSWLSGCQWNGLMCQERATCNNYFVSAASESARGTRCLGMSSSTTQSCTYPAVVQASSMSKCRLRTCAEKFGATSNSDCKAWLANCRFVGSEKCVDSRLSCDYQLQVSTELEANNVCQQLDNGLLLPTSCVYNSAQGVCRLISCAEITGATSQENCDAKAQSCIYTGANTCISADPLCTYLPNGTTDAQKKEYCERLRSSKNGSRCTFRSGAARCELMYCQDVTSSSQLGCNAQLSTCIYSIISTKCLDINVDCNYAVFGTSNQQRISFCETLKDGIQDGALGCTYTLGSPICRKKVCSDILNPSSQLDCNNLPNCILYKSNPFRCVALDANCDYLIIGNSFEEKKAFCSGLRSASGVLCDFVDIISQSNCSVATCSSVISPTSQSDCSYTPNCLYNFQGACIQLNSICAYTAQGSNNNLKRDYCQALKNSLSQGKTCTYSEGSATCRLMNCEEIITPSSQSSCNLFIPNGCIFVTIGTEKSCLTIKSNCDYTAQGASDTARLNYCSSLNNGATTPIQCSYTSGNLSCAFRTCAERLNPSSNSDCTNWLSTCRWAGGSTCVNASATCDYTISSQTTVDGVSSSCSSLTNTEGVLCTHIHTQSCVEKDCTNLVAPYTVDTCRNWSSTCQFNGTVCVQIQTDCQAYILPGDILAKTNLEKRTYCKNLKITSGESCDFINGQNQCAARTCERADPAPSSQADCVSWISKCFWNGLGCLQVNSCQSYQALGQDENAKAIYCRGLRDSSSALCGYVAGSQTCFDRTCANAPTPTIAADCTSYLSTCRITHTTPRSCISETNTCAGYTGLPDFCQNLTANGNKCWFDENAPNSVATKCVARLCTHNKTATNNDSCKLFMDGCKTSGKGCILQSVSCSALVVESSEACLNFLDASGALCLQPLQTKTTCKERFCSDAPATLVTDAECKAYLEGCVTNGKGCLASGEACHKYTGTQAQCKLFKGNSKPCWNTVAATSSTPCVTNVCSNDTTSTTDQQCAQHLAGCISNGRGCIDPSASCDAYFGTQAACAQIWAKNGTVPCWNSSFAGDGARCMCFTLDCSANGLKCEHYKGKQQDCEQQTAIDGPCKSKDDTAQSKCTPRICSEAPKSYTNDRQCQTYHPTCYTTGQGCSTQRFPKCTDVSDLQQCNVIPGCQVIYGCRQLFATCDQMTSAGASFCMNTQLSDNSMSCIWKNDNCVSTLQPKIDSCNNYNERLHQACIAKMPVCISDGAKCVARAYCKDYLTATSCYLDANDQPCYWINNQCFSEICEAFNYSTSEQCYQASWNHCTSDGVKCVSIQLCEVYTLQESCYFGFDGVCGWDLQSKQCLKFTNCNQVKSSNPSNCQTYNSSCVSDEQLCQERVKCELTKTKFQCLLGGTDGPCYYETECRLRQCKDARLTDITLDTTKHEDCYSFAADSKCTTNGFDCIPLRACDKYDQKSCILGVDGTCAFDTLTNKCRVKRCTDYPLTFTQLCQNENKSCVSDGNKCVPIGSCPSYTKRISCQSGGNENGANNAVRSICAFTPDPGDPNSGSCKLMQSCSDADQDETVCKLYPKKCIWQTNIQNAGGIIASRCKQLTCSDQTTQLSCLPIGSFDEKVYTICIWESSGCKVGIRESLNSTNCFTGSVQTAAWNSVTNKCQVCKGTITKPVGLPILKMASLLLIVFVI